MTEIVRMDAHTWRIEDGHVRFFLLEGTEKAALIDSGVNCPGAAELARTLTDRPLLLLNTHGDRDHTSGTGGFSEIHIHPADYVRCRLQEKYPGTVPVELQDGDVIELGERPLKIIHIPGHTGGSVAVLDVMERVLYAGDSVQKGHIFMFGAHRDPGLFEDSLDRLIALESEYDCICASHSECQLPCGYARKVKEAWRQVRNGEVPFEQTEVHETVVRSFTTPFCGFYTDGNP